MARRLEVAVPSGHACVPLVALGKLDRAVSGRGRRGVSPARGVEVDEGDDEGVQEERNTVDRPDIQGAVDGDVKANRPEHDQDVRDVIHPLVVRKVELLVGSRHE